MAKKPVRHKAAAKKSNVVPIRETKPEAKPAKPSPWQPIESAPTDTLVYVQSHGTVLAAILDGHWYVAAGGRPTTKIIYDPTHWMPFPKE